MKLLTVLEACEMLRVSKGTLYGLIHAGRIPFVRVGQSKGFRLALSDIEDFIDGNRKVFQSEECTRRKRKFKHLKLS